MSIETIVASKSEAEQISNTSEGHFSDVKAIEVSPTKLSKIISAFANADGGELYIGIDEQKSGTSILRSWRGFERAELANGHLQCFKPLFPLGQDFQYEFIKCADYPGIVLHIQIAKTQDMKKASSGIFYLRRGAQSLPQTTAEEIRRLEYAKGITSFETELLNVPVETITDSDTIKSFITQVVPRAEPESWLKKQSLIRDGKPTVAGVLLFSDEPQATLPKRSGIKIYRYKTKDAEGSRETLAFDPITVEGPLYAQIKAAVELTIKKVEEIPTMGAGGLEAIKYPPVTLHEIITNAVLHRDYHIADDVHIRIFENRIEVKSPGRLPAHITIENIRLQRFARNGSVVRVLNKFPNPPNKDVGEGLNTAFAAMHKIGLKEPIISEEMSSVLVYIRHETLASPEEAIMDFLVGHDTINNSEARDVTHIQQDWRIRKIFHDLEAKNMIERLPNTTTSNTAYRKPLKN